MQPRHSHFFPSLCLVLAMFLWGSSFVAMKLAFQDYHPMVVIFGRMSVASLAFLCFLPRFRTIHIRRQDWHLFAVMALSEPCLYFFFEALALQNTSASQASLITAMLPLLITIASICLLSERASKQTLTGLFLAMGGAIILSLGSYYQEQGDLGKAKEQFQQALTRQPDNASALSKMGLLLLNESSNAAAKTMLEKAIKADESYVPSYYYLGYLTGKEGDMKKATELFTSAEELNPMDYQINVYRGKMFEEKNNMEQAATSYKNALKQLLNRK